MSKENLEREQLIKLLNEYPNLSVVYVVNNFSIDDDYGCIVLYDFSASKEEIYIEDNYTYLSKDEYIENLCDRYEGDPSYSGLNKKEYLKAMEDLADKAEHYEAIVIYIS